MRERDWRDFLDEQARRGKRLYTVTELAHVARTSRAAVNVELHRLLQRGVIARYAQGLYGPPHGVSRSELLAGIDSHAYLTGATVLHDANVITQHLIRHTCFTDRHSPRAVLRDTPLGQLQFVTITGRVYAQPPDRPVAAPEQALCDLVYLCRRRALDPRSLSTFRNLDRLDHAALARHLPRYPATVRKHVQHIIARPHGPL